MIHIQIISNLYNNSIILEEKKALKYLQTVYKNYLKSMTMGSFLKVEIRNIFKIENYE